MRWPRPVYVILPFIYILVGGAVLYRAATVVAVVAGTLLIGAGAIILQMRHDCQHHLNTSRECAAGSRKRANSETPGESRD